MTHKTGNRPLLISITLFLIQFQITRTRQKQRKLCRHDQSAGKLCLFATLLTSLYYHNFCLKLKTTLIIYRYWFGRYWNSSTAVGQAGAASRRTDDSSFLTSPSLPQTTHAPEKDGHNGDLSNPVLSLYIVTIIAICRGAVNLILKI